MVFIQMKLQPTLNNLKISLTNEQKCSYEKAALFLGFDDERNCFLCFMNEKYERKVNNEKQSSG